VDLRLKTQKSYRYLFLKHMKSSLKRGIYEFHFEVTGNCNLNCVYCYNSDCKDPKYREKELSIEEIKSLIKETKKYGTKLYTVSGGEPFMREDFFEIIKQMAGCSVSILTNGKVLTKDLIKELKKYPQIKEFKLSWDGFDSHNKLRIGSNWKDVEKTIVELKKNGYKVVINTIVLDVNQKDIYKLYHKIKKLEVDRWRVDMPFIFGRYIKNIKKYAPPDPKYFTEIFKKIIQEENKNGNKMILEIFNLYKSQFKPSNTVVFDTNTHPCEYKRELLSMKPNGDIIFCPSLNFAMANYRIDGSLSGAFKKERKHSFYNIKTSDLKDCVNCRYLKICGGGCRANAIYEFNDYCGKDSTACATFPEWEKTILPILKKSHKEYFKKLINYNGKNPIKSY